MIDRMLPIWRAQLLQRANEAIALDYIVPWRVILPRRPHPDDIAEDNLDLLLAEVHYARGQRYSA